jgi:hypothetical protein
MGQGAEELVELVQALRHFSFLEPSPVACFEVEQ